MPRSVSDLGDEVVFLERDFESSASQLQTQRSDKHALTRSRVSGDDATVEVISVQLGGSQPAMGNRWELDHNDAPRGVVHKAGSIPADPRLPPAGLPHGRVVDDRRIRVLREGGGNDSWLPTQVV